MCYIETELCNFSTDGDESYGISSCAEAFFPPAVSGFFPIYERQRKPAILVHLLQMLDGSGISFVLNFLELIKL